MKKLIPILRKSILTYFFIIISIAILYGQDRLYYHSGEIVKVKVMDFDDYTITFLAQGDETPQKIDRDQIKKIEYADGAEEFGNRFPRMRAIKNQKKIGYSNIIKFSLSGIPSNHLEIGFETRLRKKLGLELKAGYMGIGISSYNWEYDNSFDGFWYFSDRERYKVSETRRMDQPQGVFIKAGPKFSLIYNNSLSGLYYKPELVLSYFHHDGASRLYVPDKPEYGYNYTWETNQVSMAIINQFGYQMVFSERMTLDISGGIGLGLRMKSKVFQGQLPGPEAQRYGIDPTNGWEWNFKPFFDGSHFMNTGFAFMGSVSLGYLF